ncbi:hypothetical protein TCAL_09074 [Tigriopus californicus]|uniref:SLC12A transporter C-terminal domain-containing protein n=1 Tax=Tigriopus californicus TaxID=6832 RepID=A0A553NQ56_TIGCA|nr:solute carrier family 12 member 2-like [Tigriopus californicus]TRY67544.1 hypothetical protein TCAL_09074 [Tigriopus californicus]
MTLPNQGFDNRAFDEGNSHDSTQELSGNMYYQSSNYSEGNQHTYVYDADQSFRKLTIEALPRETNYRRLTSIMAGSDFSSLRPTVDELAAGKRKAIDFSNLESGKDDDLSKKAPTGKVIKFGWIDGVLMRCLLNIWGVMLFLRLSWVVGQCGIVQGLMVISMCNLVTLLTGISMSAVSTNGIIKGGGIYYMLSRSLGAEFGGAIGIMFTLANSIAVATYIIGFVDSLLDMLKENIEGFNGFAGTIDHRLNDMRWIGAVTLTLVLILAIVGMEWVTRVEKVLLCLLIVSQIDFVIGTFFPADEEKKYGFVGYSSEVFSTNLLNTNYHDNKNPENPPGFFQVAAVFFPAVTGIVAGANLSGDLRDPGEAIPKGTLTAIGMTYVTYMLYAVLIGSVYLPEASGIESEYLAYLDHLENGTTSSFVASMNGSKAFMENGTFEDDFFYNNCTTRDCFYGSSNDQQTLSKISLTGYLVYAGCFAATISSAIASLVGAPRVLQALAKDNLYPGLSYFGKGFGANNDPRRGYIVVFFIALGCIMIGNLDIVSSLLSNFFVAGYALINFSVFHASITKSPGWRPSFKYYNKWVALFGTVLCVAVMFLMSPVTALITFGCIAVLYFFISYRKPEANWGSSRDAQQFVTSLRNLQSLNVMQQHVKNYRPMILCLSGIPAHRRPLVDFANLLTKKLSLLICADVESDSVAKARADEMSNDINHWMEDHQIKAFFSLTQSATFDDGAISTINLTGLGKLKPNVVMMGFKNNWIADKEGCESYTKVIHHCFEINLSVVLLKLKNGCDFSNKIKSEKPITVTVTQGERPHAEVDLDMLEDLAAEEDEEDVGHHSAIKEKKKQPKKKKKDMPAAVLLGSDGRPLPANLVREINMFKTEKRKGFIDVWWLYDDGGLTLLLPHILTKRAQFSECHLRVFSLATKNDALDMQSRSMANLLAKFRIDFHDVIMIPDIGKKASEETKAEFNTIVSQANITSEDLVTNLEKTNRHLRLAELLREHSMASETVIMTLPIPRKSSHSDQLWMAWLEIMSRDMPPMLFVRGNQTSVLTFYS